MKKRNDEFEVIELSMLDKKKFFPLSGIGSFTVHSMLYPLVLVRIRLQLQEGARLYTGLAHATASILREEGFRGLYSGYFVKSAQIISSVFYASTYETIRHMAIGIPGLSPTQRSFIGGGVASMLLQTVLVPIDVISQHLMVLSRASSLPSSAASPSISSSVKLITKSSAPAVLSDVRLDQVRALSPIRLSASDLSTSWARFRAVTYYVAQKHGFRGFYNGYVISLCTFVPSSAMWWAFYDKFCRMIASTASDMGGRVIGSTGTGSTDNSSPRIPRLAIQLCAAPLAGIASATLVNPIDCIRVRMQVGHLSFRETTRILWVTEGFRWFAKGLSARLLQTSVFSFWLILIYEPVKVFCLKSEYRDRFRSSYDEW